MQYIVERKWDEDAELALIARAERAAEVGDALVLANGACPQSVRLHRRDALPIEGELRPAVQDVVRLVLRDQRRASAWSPVRSSSVPALGTVSQALYSINVCHLLEL